MKTDNLHPSGERAAVTTRGWAAASRAIGGVTATDGATVVFGVKELQFDGAIVTDLDEDAALVTITGGGGTSSVSEFGAVGDGVADDTAEIQAAIDATCTAGGGIVYFPVGTYLISATLTITCDGLTLVGDGPGASIIKAAAGLATGNMIEITGDMCSVLDLALTSAAQKTGGIGIYCNAANNVAIARVALSNQYDSIKFNGSIIVRIADCNLYDQKRHGIWITGSGNDYYFSRIVADNSPSSTGIGIYTDGGCQAIFGENCDFIHFTNGLLMQPSATSTWHFFTGMVFDTCSNDGIHLGGGAALLYGVTFVNCWSASNTAQGVFIGANVEGVQFVGGKVLNNGQHGFNLNGSCTRVAITDNLIVSNSQSASGTYSGIQVDAACTHIAISGNHAYNGLALGSTQKYGLTFDTGATDYLSIDGNDFSGNVTGEINNLAGVSGTHRWQGGGAGDTGWSATTFWRGDGTWATPASGSPTTADYLVGTAQAGLSAEIVVGTTPGGELGGTWASPTVDATHSGSAHADAIAKAIVDVKGDLIAATAADTVARVAVGADGTYLKADSGASAGVSWDSPSGSGSVATDAIWDAAGDLAVGSGANTAAKLVMGAPGGALSRVNGAVTWNSGTSFPTAATGDRYWRTDRGVEYYYDGTRWLSVHVETSTLAVQDTLVPVNAINVGFGYGPLHAGDDVWLIEAIVSTQVQTTNNGSNYWTVAVKKSPSGTSLGTFTTAADTAGAGTNHRITIGALSGTTDAYASASCTVKTGAPGVIYAFAKLRYRLVG